MLKEKAYKFMEKHPKLTGFAVSSACSLAVAAPMATNSLVASAEGEPAANQIDTVTATLVSSASSAFSNAITQITPVLCMVIGYNVVVRLVRRFIKG